MKRSLSTLTALMVAAVLGAATVSAEGTTRIRIRETISWELSPRPGTVRDAPISPQRRAFVAYRAALADFDAGGAAKAEQDLEEALRAMPGWTDALDLLGLVAELTRRPQQAAEHYRRALDRDPQDVFASHALKQLGEEVEPQGGEGADEAYRLYRRGLETLLSGRDNPALGEASAAARALSSWPDAHLLLGYCYERAEDRDQALSAYKNALHFAPGDLHAIQALVNIGYLPQTGTDMADLEQMTVDLINEERARHGIPRLTVNHTLVKVARQHSAEMRDLQYFSHESPVPGREQLRQRYNLEANDQPRMLGENISRRFGFPTVLSAANVRISHANLMTSPPHRANILHPAYQEIGVGFAINDRGDYWITEVFRRK